MRSDRVVLEQEAAKVGRDRVTHIDEKEGKEELVSENH
jgi:hypothetical protein